MAKTKSKHKQHRFTHVRTLNRDAEYVYNIERRFVLLTLVFVLGMICVSTFYIIYKKYEIRKVDSKHEAIISSASDTSTANNVAETDVITNVINEHIGSKANDILIDGIDTAASAIKAPLLRL